MKKKDFFSKMTINNYNNELEEILEKKNFREDVKNLLLSMLYKIELTFKDYQELKKISISQNEFIEELLRIIREDCIEIEIVEPNSKKGKILSKYGLGSISDSKSKSIITYPSEKDLLYSLYEISNNNFGISNKYSILCKIIPIVLKKGNSMNNVEIIRDFSGWSWNLEKENIENFQYNAIYQNIRILSSYSFLDKWLHQNVSKIDYLLLLKKELLEKYNTSGKIFYEEFIQMCVLANMYSDKKVEEQLLFEKKESLNQLNLMLDKTSFIDKISENKKTANEKVKQIDKIISNKELLKKEFNRYNKTKSIQEFEDMLRERREKLMMDILQYNRLMDPRQYVTNVEELKNKQKILEKVNKSMITEENINRQIIELQKKFLDCISLKVQEITTKSEMIELIYHLRYYRKMPINKNIIVEDIEELKRIIIDLEEMIIQKSTSMKILNTISKNSSFNLKIIKNIFESKIIKLDNIEFEFIPKYDKLQVNVYDRDFLDYKFEIETNGAADKLSIRTKKKIKLFI